MVSAMSCAAWATINGYVNGLKVAAAANGTINGNCETVTFVIPPEATYYITNGTPITSWFELR